VEFVLFVGQYDCQNDVVCLIGLLYLAFYKLLISRGHIGHVLVPGAEGGPFLDEDSFSLIENAAMEVFTNNGWRFINTSTLVFYTSI
jgi:hypothetical protein